MSQSIVDVLGQIRGGAAVNKAGKQLEELVKAVLDTGKAGSISLIIDVKPDKTDNRVVMMKPTIKTKVPERGWSEGIFFMGPDGKLTKDDPAQLELLEERRQNNVASIAANEANLSRVGQG